MQTLELKKLVFLAIMLHGLSEFWKSALQLGSHGSCSFDDLP